MKIYNAYDLKGFYIGDKKIKKGEYYIYFDKGENRLIKFNEEGLVIFYVNMENNNFLINDSFGNLIDIVDLKREDQEYKQKIYYTLICDEETEMNISIFACTKEILESNVMKIKDKLEEERAEEKIIRDLEIEKSNQIYKIERMFKKLQKDMINMSFEELKDLERKLEYEDVGVIKKEKVEGRVLAYTKVTKALILKNTEISIKEILNILGISKKIFYELKLNEIYQEMKNSNN